MATVDLTREELRTLIDLVSRAMLEPRQGCDVHGELLVLLNKLTIANRRAGPPHD